MISSSNNPSLSAADTQGYEEYYWNGVNQIVDLLLREKILTPKQVEYAKRIQSKLESFHPLLDVFKDLKFISDDQIKETIKKNRIDIPLGTLLLALGYISKESLRVALDIQSAEKKARRLGDILVDKGYITEKAFLEVLSLQLGLPFIDAEFTKIDVKLFSKVPIKWYESHALIPIREEKNGIRVALADPTDRGEIEAAQHVFGNKILPAIAGERAIRKAIKKIQDAKVAKKTSATQDNAIVRLVDNIIMAAVERNASDIHIEPSKDRLRIRFRQDGVLCHFKDFPPEIVPALTNRIKVLCDVDITEKRRHQGGRFFFEHPDGALDLRVSFYVTIHGEKIVLRLLNRQIGFRDLEDIGISARILQRFKDEALFLPSGVILITGPTGSGKTSSVYSCISKINNPSISIITAEDPVEYIVESIAQCSLNPKIDLTFEETLRHIVRQDPDVIVIGEIRDKFSAEIAVQAALTGHKVITTFHTEDSIGGLIRLLKMDIEAFLISSTVVSVLAQRLLRKICPECVMYYKPGFSELNRLGYRPDDIKGAEFRKGKGCPKCQHTGYKGRLGVFELLVLNEPVREAILDQKTSQEIRKISIESGGLVTLMEDGIFKAAAGITTIDEVLRCLPPLQKPRPIEKLRLLLGA